MIEINLVPDVKQELIRAQRVRSVVISMTILVGIVAVGIVAILVAWIFIVQSTRGMMTDKTIKNEYAKLASVEDLDNSLTIQNQLGLLPKLHGEKRVHARMFDLLTTINPAAPNDVTISRFVINEEDETITIEAQAVGGYPAFEVFKKTIAATQFQYLDDDNKQEVQPLAMSISDGERSYGENAGGEKVLRFMLTFEYNDKLFAPYLKDASIVGPDRANVTDSNLGIPKSLFSPKASDSEEEAS